MSVSVKPVNSTSESANSEINPSNSSTENNLALTVAKFGGTSVADFAAMQRCVQIIKNDPNNRLVAVSASAGVTNNLVRLSQANVEEAEQAKIIEEISGIQQRILANITDNSALSSQINGLLAELAAQAKIQSVNYSAKTADEILSFGERMSSLIFAEIMRMNDLPGLCFDVRQVMKTNSLYGQAVVDIEQLKASCQQHLSELLKSHVVVTQGFIGQDGLGCTTTLGRGGSDYSAALLAEAIDASNLAIWTDVVGIFTTDPRITEQARAIKEISFGEAAEMATFGAKILHPATLIPAMRQNIPVFVGSSKEPNKGGTRIQKQVESNPTYRSIALRREQTLVTVKSPAMLHASGFLAKVFAILAQHELSVDLITTSEISVALTFDNPPGSTQAVITDQVIKELSQLCEVKVEEGLSLVAVIGNDLHSSSGSSSTVFNTIEAANVRMICQGASRHNLCFLVQDDEANGVVEQLHHKLFA